eukprot:INCI17241.2.p1 GENE.INCI17241.2~~INCI17241.2.p1  ORF type:complete len:400 (+),score=76.78 INCI17241.2:189-1388(+)
MSAKWECEKCLFDNEAAISFCQLCGHHAAVDLLRLHVVDKDAEIAELTRVRDGYSPDEAVVQKAYLVREQLMDIIAAAEREEKKQRQKEEEDKKKQLEEDGRPWPSLEQTVGSLFDSVSAGIDDTLPTFTYSWSSKEAGGQAANSANSPVFALGAGESKIDATDTERSSSAALLAGGRTAQGLKNEKGERLTFPQMSDGTVVKRITSYDDKAAIRQMLRYFDDRTLAHCLIEHEDPGGQYWALEGVDPERKKRCMLPPFGWSTPEKRDTAMLVPAKDRWEMLMECGEFYMKFGNSEDADSMLEGALYVAERTWSHDHRFVGQTCNSLGWLRMEQDDFEGAVTLFKRAYDVYYQLEYPAPDSVEVLGNHPMCSSIVQTIARIKAMIASRNARRKESKLAN